MGGDGPRRCGGVGLLGRRGRLGNQYHSHWPGALEFELQAAVWGLLAPVLAKLLSFCLPALKLYGKTLLASSPPAGGGKLHLGMLRLRKAAMAWDG